MDFYVYDTNLNIVGIIDNYSSVIWTLRYNDVGDFEIYIKSDPAVLEMCKINRYIVRDSDNTVMIIKSVTTNESAENGDYITVTGVSIENILSRRIVWNYTILQGRIEECIYSLITNNCTNPANSARSIPRLQLSPLKHLTAEIDLTEYTGTNVLDAVVQLCAPADYGFRITFKNGTFVFEIYEGADHSYNQSANDYIIYGTDNISESTQTNDYSAFKNVALIGGSGEGMSRTFASYGTAAGLERFETYVENTSISDVDLLRSAAREMLLETHATKTFEGEISDYYTYGVNYSLGDVVQIVNKNNVTATARIIGITQSIDDTGIHTIPEFTTWEV